MSLDHAVADAKDTQVPVVLAINEGFPSSLAHIGADRNVPGVEQSDGQGQAREALKVLEVGRSKVEAMPFEINHQTFSLSLYDDDKRPG